MGITHETRREAHENIKPLKPNRHQLCLMALEKLGKATAKEVARWLYKQKIIPYPERNFAHPRLNELVQMGKVEVIDKKLDRETRKHVAVYQIVKEPEQKVENLTLF